MYDGLQPTFCLKTTKKMKSKYFKLINYSKSSMVTFFTLQKTKGLG